MNLEQFCELVSVSFQCQCGICLLTELSCLKESITIFFCHIFAFLIKNITKESVKTRVGSSANTKCELNF